jgi:hypothetical protein
MGKALYLARLARTKHDQQKRTSKGKKGGPPAWPDWRGLAALVRAVAWLLRVLFEHLV